jgi:hypothetical protein
MGVVVSLVVFIGCVGVRPTFIPQAIFKLHPFRLSSSFSCSLIDRACSLSMFACCFGSDMCCAHDSSEKRGTDTFLPGRFDQGFMW